MGIDVGVLVLPRLSALKRLFTDLVGIMDVFILRFQVGVPAMRCDTITRKLEIFVECWCQVQNADKGEDREHQWPNTKQVERAASLHWAIILAAFYRRTISQLLICRLTGHVRSSTRLPRYSEHLRQETVVLTSPFAELVHGLFG